MPAPFGTGWREQQTGGNGTAECVVTLPWYWAVVLWEGTRCETLMVPLMGGLHHGVDARRVMWRRYTCGALR
jgi:hypothetical protein